MELDRSLVREAEVAFGAARDVCRLQEILPWEMDLIDRVCGTHRYHDVTVFVLRGGAEPELALIHKPSDPPGAFWAPAGGVNPGEGLGDAVVREVFEETGLVVRPERYVLRLAAEFRAGARARAWVSHVFTAGYVSGEPQPVDSREVESAAWITVAEFWHGVAPILREAGWGRFEYRLGMAELVFEMMGFPREG